VKLVRLWLIGCLAAGGCNLLFEATAAIDATPDGDGAATLIDASPDGPVDAGPDAPPDAFACTVHSQCSSQTPGTCCVSPGPGGICAEGIVIGGVCVPPT
jgi:hypothetical protein